MTPNDSHAPAHGAEVVHNKETHPVGSVVPPNYLPQEVKFGFKQTQVKDDAGNPVTDESGNTVKTPKRAPVTLQIPFPTFNGLVAAFNDEKVITYVLDLVAEAIKDRVRVQLTDEDKPVLSQEDLDLSQLTLEYIANLPKSERTGGGISKETWADFREDYITTMGPMRASADNITLQEGMVKATKAADFFVKRLNTIRGEKPVLKFLRGQLSIWMQESKVAQEEFAEVYTYLIERADKLLAVDGSNMLAAL